MAISFVDIPMKNADVPEFLVCLPEGNPLITGSDNPLSEMKPIYGDLHKWGHLKKSSILIGFSIINQPFWDPPL